MPKPRLQLGPGRSCTLPCRRDLPHATCDDTARPNTDSVQKRRHAVTISLAVAIDHSPPAADDPEPIWAALAPLIAARPTMRLWSPQQRFGEVRRLTTKLPAAPAAVPVYRRGRTHMLVFDLDAKRRGRNAVAADRQRILEWIHACGGRAISDSSTSGGSHVIVPLTQATPMEDLRPVLAAVAARCPTLDLTPMLNTSAGCISVPGSACREGGHRILHGTIDDAVKTLTHANAPELLADLQSLLGVPHSPAIAAPADSHYFTGSGPTTQLRWPYRRTTSLPTPVAAFAKTGALPTDGRWASRSEARLSVLVHLMWRGHTLPEIRHQIRPDQPLAGLAVAYRRYSPSTDRALLADWAAARTWLEHILPTVHSGTHKSYKHTGGSRAGGTAPHALWLAHALWWCDTTLRANPSRWLVAAVLQALAISALRAGEVIKGVPVVAVGGRSLSVAAGLVSESAVWSALRMLRDCPGSPVLLVQRGTGTRADRYALTTPDVADPRPDAPDRARVCDVHPVWATVGLQYRRVYELVQSGAAVTVEEVRLAARISRSSAYDAVAELARLDLLRRRDRQLEPGGVSLDELATRLGIPAIRAARIAAHQHARQQWRRWLNTRQVPYTEPALVTPPQYGHQTQCDPLSPHDTDEYLAAVMATGPPELQP